MAKNQTPKRQGPSQLRGSQNTPPSTGSLQIPRRKSGNNAVYFSGHSHRPSYKRFPTENLFVPSSEEASWFASAKDFENSKDLKGIAVFTGTQGGAAAGLWGYASIMNDVGNAILAPLNIGRNGLWFASHLGVKYIPDLAAVKHTTKAKACLSVNKALESSQMVKSCTSKLRSIFRKSARDSMSQARDIQKPINEKMKSQMWRDIQHAKINSAGALSGAGIHVFPLFLTTEPLLIIGTSAAIGGYLLMGLDQAIESKKWSKIYNATTDKNQTYDHKEAHLLVGYSASGNQQQYYKDFLFKWVPPLLLAAKGGTYLAESFLLASHHEPTAAVAALGVSGALFTGGSLYEFWEHNHTKIDYLIRQQNNWKEQEEALELADENAIDALSPEHAPNGETHIRIANDNKDYIDPEYPVVIAPNLA